MPVKKKSTGGRKVRLTKGGKYGIDQKALYSALMKADEQLYNQTGKEAKALKQMRLLVGVAVGAVSPEQAGMEFVGGYYEGD